MSISQAWKKLAALAKTHGLAARVGASTEAAKTPTYGKKPRRGDPTDADVAPWLPAEYRAFVGEVGFVAADFGERARLAFLPPRLVRQVTGAMSDGKTPFDEQRTLREKGSYRWPFAFFAGYDLADVNGWCFAPKDDATPAPLVWAVEESVPVKRLGSFDVWASKEIARLTAKIESAAKAARVVRALREELGLEHDEPLPRVALDDFGA